MSGRFGVAVAPLARSGRMHLLRVGVLHTTVCGRDTYFWDECEVELDEIKRRAEGGTFCKLCLAKLNTNEKELMDLREKVASAVWDAIENSHDLETLVRLDTLWFDENTTLFEEIEIRVTEVLRKERRADR